MIWCDEELGGIGESFVFRIPAGIGVSVRTYDRQVADAFIKRPGEPARRWFDRKKPILMQQCHSLPAVAHLQRKADCNSPAN
ncbi:hypothetical protein D3C87_1770740 [compost metagenome]